MTKTSKQIVSVFANPRDPWPMELKEMTSIGKNVDGYEVFVHSGDQFPGQIRDGKMCICLAYPCPANKRVEKK